MTYPRAQGTPNYSGNQIPFVFSTRTLVKFYEASVLAAIASTDYEGEIKNHGDKVIIRTTPDITISDYVKGQPLITQRPDSDPVELVIDKGKYWQFTVEDVDAFQMDIDFQNKCTTDASEKMKIAIDTDVLGNIAADIAAINRGATAGKISSALNLGSTGAAVPVGPANVVKFITYLGQVLDEQNVPENGRWLVVPAWLSGMIKRSDLKDASLTGDSTTPLRNGRLGMIDRFTLYSSNLLARPADTNNPTRILAGHPSGLTFASQLVKTESLRAESTFGTLVRGLQVYGYEVVKPDALSELYAYPSESAT